MKRLTPSSKKRFPWVKAILFYAATLIIGGLTSGPSKNTEKFYENELKQAPWAPPGWVFGPAWALINVFITRALFQILEEKDKRRKDKALLRLQLGIWFIFCTFGIVYFKKQSPVLAAAWTVADAALATASIALARKKGINFTANYLPLLVWTYFASTVAVYQALENPDPLLNTPAIISTL